MRVLVVEDEKDLNRIIYKKLKVEGYSVDCCYNGEEALDYINSTNYDIIIMDIMMPKKNGYEVLKNMRENKNNTPVLFLTAKDTIEDRVIGLDLGADDYLIKPFHFDELMARIRVLIRRKHGNINNELKVADLVLNVNTHTVKRGNKEIDLSSKEFSILEYMMQNVGIVLSREKLEEHIWNYDYQGASNMIDVYIRYLRVKIDKDFETKLIHTVRGVGYVLKDKEL
ncbi:MAG: response regulator transcription factor [Fusobacterium perfoetens]|uniref:response regulator transcription factor n=1 Tax=Fusobacterium perfoetens TaxID=852 RepID=UPI0023F0D596|nr:response regulator transcription factor [Fusobacterium perfoetens]MCI6153409.1 response regulator transcription factor [Fusobacterium perfoetens]MDY3238448.1 response regulator transcription factor [Fusobacterium perfoetens]